MCSLGRDHHVQMQFCECEEYGSQLVRFGFWPSTPVRPTTAFSMELLRLLNILTLECSVSVAGMVQTLRWMNNLSSKQVSKLAICFLLMQRTTQIPKKLPYVADEDKHFQFITLLSVLYVVYEYLVCVI